MRKFLSILYCVVFVYQTASAQTWAEVSSDPEHYVWGEGWGKTLEEADNQALSMLASKISLIVYNEFHSVEGQASTSNGSSRYASIENALHAFSSASLTNTGVEVLEKGRHSHIVRWIRKEDINRMTDRRGARVLELVAEAERCEQAGKVGDAIRGYYWAFAMVRSYQDISKSSYTDDNGISHILMNWLPEKLGSILSDIRATVQSLGGGSAVLSFSFRGKPLSGIDFFYFDGSRWSGPVNVRGGRQAIELAYNSRPEYFHIRYEYAYTAEARSDREISYALEKMKDEPLRKANVALYCNKY